MSETVLFGGAGAFPTAVQSASYGNGTWVAALDANCVLVSTDSGVTWRRVASVVTGLANAAGYFRNVAFSPVLGLFAATHTKASGCVWTSPDGITWTSHALPGGITGGIVGSGTGAPGFVVSAAAGDSTASSAGAYSTDGVTWTSVTFPTAVQVTAIKYGGGVWNLSSGLTQNTLLCSTNGTSWSVSVPSGWTTTTSLEYNSSSGRWAAGGSSTYSRSFRVSTDGRIWRAVDMGGGYYVHGTSSGVVAFGDGFVFENTGSGAPFGTELRYTENFVNSIPVRLPNPTSWTGGAYMKSNGSQIISFTLAGNLFTTIAQ